MKNIFIILSICAIHVCISQAQEMGKGMSLFNAGAGFVPGWGINACYEYGLVDTWGSGVFTIGAYVGYGYRGEKIKSAWSDGDPKYHVNTLAFGPRATYRYAFTDSFEVYWAIMFGAIVHTYSKHYDSESGSFFEIAAGCRYTLFGSSFSVFAETGYHVSYLKCGLCYSF